MTKRRYYSQVLFQFIVSVLYHKTKLRKLPM